MKLSIITVNYNNASGLKRTIESVISQSYTSFEYLIIDGGSTDGSKTIIESFDSKIDYWVSEKDKGIYNAMNKGIKQAKGDYLLFLNSGDTLYNSSVLEDIFSQNTNAGIIYGNFQVIFPDGKEELRILPESITIPFLLTRTICHQASFIKKELFDKYGLYREDLNIVSDWAFFLKVFFFDRTTQKYIPSTISNYYLDGLSSLDENQEFILREREKVLFEDFYTELSDAYHTINEYRLFYNKPIFIKIRKVIDALKRKK